MTSDRDQPDWLAELARGGESVRRQALPIVRAAKRFVDDARWAQGQTGTPLPFSQRVALAMDAGVREVIAAMRTEDQGPVVYVHAEVAAVSAAVASADVIRVDEDARVVVLEDSGAATDQLAIRDRTVTAGQVLALVLVWVLAVGAPVAQQVLPLPPEAQAVVTNEYATLALALAITWQILRKRDS